LFGQELSRRELCRYETRDGAKESKMKVVVDYDLCEANALCMKAAPEIFRVEDDDTLTVLIDSVPADLKEKALEAARLCPRQAISYEG
jgi:ferredoxin